MILKGVAPTVRLKVSTVDAPLQIEVVPEIEPLGSGLTFTSATTGAEGQLFALPVIVYETVLGLLLLLLIVCAIAPPHNDRHEEPPVTPEGWDITQV